MGDMHSAQVDPLSFDPKHDDFMQNPWAFYDALQAAGGILHDPRSDIVYIGRYALIEEVMHDPSTYSSTVDRAGMRKGGMPDEVIEIRKRATPLEPTLSQNDAPSHDAYRSILTPFFRPNKLKQLEPYIEARVSALFAAMTSQGGGDFLQDFAVPLPISVIGEYLGFQRHGWDALKRWSDAFADEIGFLTDDARAIEIARLTLACHQAMLDDCAAKRENPQDDLMSVLATCDYEGRALNDGELLSILTQLLVAGNETTTNTLCGGIIRLAEAPELADTLRLRPEKIGRFIEEVLRLESPVQGQFRKTTKPVTLGGLDLPEGQLIHVRLACGSRDPDVFEDANQLDLEGKRKQHLSFGMGMHFCIGALLSKLELKLAFAHILANTRTISLAVPKPDIRYHTHFHLRGPKSVPVAFA